MNTNRLRGLQANIRKHFIILFTGRRNFIPILSIYYLSLPDTNAQQIGVYTGIGYAASLLFQIPAGIIGDRLGNKTTIIIAKVLLLVSSLIFVIGDSFVYFIIGSMLLSLGADAFATGNTSAFLHDTLVELKKENDFKMISSKMRGWVSFLSIFFIIALPFFTHISLVLPFQISLVIDVFGLLVALSLYPARGHSEHHEPISFANIKNTIIQSKGTGLFPIICFASVIAAFLIVDGAFRSPYLVALGYPVAWIGFVMGLSRFVWFIVSRFTHKIENIIPFKRLMLVEILIFSLYYVSAYFIANPYVIGIIFSIVIGYFWGRSDIYIDHIINLIPGKKYKSTILSIKGQITGIIQVIGIFAIGSVMNYSYKIGFLVMGIVLFVMLISIYRFSIRKLEIENSKETL